MWPDKTRQISETISRSKQAASSGDQTDTFAENPAMSGSGGGISASSLALFMSRLLRVVSCICPVRLCVCCSPGVSVCEHAGCVLSFVLPLTTRGLSPVS